MPAGGSRLAVGACFHTSCQLCRAKAECSLLNHGAALLLLQAKAPILDATLWAVGGQGMARLLAALT
jgi:hypothetical protein